MLRSIPRYARLCRSRPAPVRYSSSASKEIHAESSPRPHPAIPSVPNTAYVAPTHPIPAPIQTDRTREVLALAEKYILPVYARPPLVMDHGKGIWIWDMDGRKYLDFTAGIAVNALGHADEGVAKVHAAVLHCLRKRSHSFMRAGPARSGE
ncbi:hypothetical protein EWM64_g3172 [Hericium alpestre]|uniref:Acetylornithine transaminase n=1 Tax=Hericium alpestre TaxID=135208 RepID=A0A4Z0A300_9AGAM|nr:hypothetical protein EWM64_g3172 [Hericium alpestre]